MADAPKIESSDYLDEAYHKINLAIINANEAKNTADSLDTNIKKAVDIQKQVTVLNKGAFDTKIIGKNKFNKRQIISGYWFNNSSGGELYTNANYFATNKIPAKPSQSYATTNISRVVEWDINGDFLKITPIYTSMSAIVTSANTYFLSFDGPLSTINTAQLEEGTAATTYEGYIEYISEKNLGSRSVRKEKLADMVVGKNKFNKANAKKGYWYNGTTNGIPTVRENYFVSDMFEGKPNQTYATKNIARVVEWDIDGNFISVTPFYSTEDKFTSKGNTRFLSIDAVTSVIDSVQLEEGATYSGYEDYVSYLNIPSKVATEKEIILPNSLVAVVGHEFNVYYKNIFKSDFTLDHFEIRVDCPIGYYYDDRFSVIPTQSNVGTHTLTFMIYDLKGYELIKKSVSLQVITDIGLTEEKEVMFIGDSLTDDGNGGSYIEELKRMCGENLKLVGTRGTAPNLHEGRAGWATGTYVGNQTLNGVVNAFYNPTTSSFDFPYYMSSQGYTTLDYVVIFLGTNDWWVNIETVISNLKQMIASIKSFNSNIKIFVVLTPPPANSQFKFGQGRLSYLRHKIAYQELNKRYMKEFENTIPVYLNIDTTYDFPIIDIPVSARNPQTRKVVDDRYHFNIYGYYKIADVVYGVLLEDNSLNV